MDEAKVVADVADATSRPAVKDRVRAAADAGVGVHVAVKVSAASATLRPDR